MKAASPNTFEDLQLIDSLLYQKKHQQAFDAFGAMLNRLGTGNFRVDQVRLFHHGDSLDDGAEICQRASAQWQQLLMSDLAFTKVDMQWVIRNLFVLHTLLMGTHEGSLDHFVVAYHQHKNGKFDLEGLCRLVLAWSPNSRTDLNIFGFHTYFPSLIFAQAVACLIDLGLVSARADKARRQALDFLLTAHPKPEQLSHYQGINLISGAWMRCSYLDDERRHQVKPLLTQVLERMVKLPASFLLPRTTGLHDGKPVLFMPLEGMVRDHAMYRCYAELIRGCRRRFFTVGLGIDAACDDTVAALFDHFEVVENSADSGLLPKAFEKVQKIISEFSPSLVWFPSIGMDRWIVLLAQRRMAPLQVMTLGHPATSMSHNVDAVLLSKGMMGERERYHEEVVWVPDEAFQYQLPSGVQSVIPLERLPEDGVVRIAVPSVAQKWTARFVTCLREVQERASRPVEFVFFCGDGGIDYAASSLNLWRELKRVRVHPILNYNDYIREINRCQIHACTFPFGGTNSLIDSLRQGVVLVAMEGHEAHERVDADFIRKVGLPDYCVTHTTEEYVAALLKLVNEPAEWQRLHDHLLHEVDVSSLFMQEGKPELFGEALFALYEERVLEKSAPNVSGGAQQAGG